MKKLKQHIALLYFICTAISSTAQTYIGYAFPAGGQQGTSFDIEVGGQNLKSTTGVYCSDEGVSGVVIQLPITAAIKEKRLKPKEEGIPQMEETVVLHISIDKKSKIGLHDFRLITENGYSNRIFFEVNELSEISEKEPNDSADKGNELTSMPIITNGRISSGERDFFRFYAKKGLQLVCQTKARALVPYIADAVPGWFQPTLTLRNDRGKEIAYNDDRGQSPDPIIISKIPESGIYTLEIHDALYRGREDFVYRISIGELPYIQNCFPIGGESGSKTKIHLEGVNLDKYDIKVKLPSSNATRFSFSTKGKNIQSNTLTLGVSDQYSIKESATKSFENPQKLPSETTIDGCISKPNEEDWYQIAGLKGEKINIEIIAHRLGSMLDADITLFDGYKNIITKVDDFEDKNESLETFHADPRLLYTFKEDQLIFIRVRDLLGKGGSAYAYRLTNNKPLQDFDLSINPSSLVIPQNGTAAFTVNAIRHNGFQKDINMQLEGLPKDFKHSFSTILKGENSLRMSITAPLNSKISQLSIKIKGISESNNNQIEKEAQPVEEQMQAFFYKHKIPTHDFLTNVVQSQHFSISHNLSIDTIYNVGKTDTLFVHLKIGKNEGFNQQILLTLDNPPKGIRMKPVTVNTDQIEATVAIFSTFGGQQTVGLVICGTSKKIEKGKKQKPEITKAFSSVFMIKTEKQFNENKKRNL